MFNCRNIIRIRNIDATGSIYFTALPEMAQEGFERYMESQGWSVKKLFNQQIFLPIVHVSSNYSAPLMLGDEVEISLLVKTIGTTSFTLFAEMTHAQSGVKAGNVTIVHVVVSKESGRATEIPEFLKTLLVPISSQSTNFNVKT